MFDNIRIILVNTTHPGNIGAAARAMKTMGLRQLVLVDPLVFPSAEATAMASGASDLLATARVVPSLEAAIADCSLVVAASARSRHIPWPLMNGRQCGEVVWAESIKHPVAMVFGREDRGLTNEELRLCNYHVSIPTDDEYGVLNVAAAVQVLAYEVRMAYLSGQQQEESGERLMPVQWVRWDEELATAEDMEQFYQHFEEMLQGIGFLAPDNPRQLMTRIRRMFSRMRLDRLEYNLLRGILKDIQHVLERAQR